MYRTPEMLDLYQNFPINEALDIWVSIQCVFLLGKVDMLDHCPEERGIFTLSQTTNFRHFQTNRVCRQQF